MAGVTDPSCLARRIADHEGVRGDVARYDSTGANEAVFAQIITTYDRRIRTDADTPLDNGLAKFVFTDHCRARVYHVGKDARGTAEYVVPKRYPVIDADVVLDFTAIANAGIRADHNVLAQNA